MKIYRDKTTGYFFTAKPPVRNYRLFRGMDKWQRLRKLGPFVICVGKPFYDFRGNFEETNYKEFKKCGG